MNEEREWYRHVSSGDRGYLVNAETICLDRVPPVEMAYRELEWKKEPGLAPLTARQVGQIAFSADRALCRMLGLVAKARREWNTLGEQEQIYFSKHGPAAPELRRKLFRAIKEELEGVPAR